MRTSDAGALLDAEHAVAQLLSDGRRLPDVASEVIAAIGAALGWQFGAGWHTEVDELRLVEIWSDGSLADRELTALCSIDRLAGGEGLPGRVWASGRPAWIVDVSRDQNFPRRRAAAAAGLRSALCFPVSSEEAGVAGVVEFFTRARLEPDDRLLATVASVGRRMGSVVDRTVSAHALRSSEATGRAILAAALDAIVTIDHRGLVVEFNPAAEQTFGYSRADVIGREMVDLIVPPRLRDRHREGVRRYLATGVANLLDRRLEISAIHADGHEFPVELAVTRIGVPGRPMFAGHIRDITERKSAEAELRASRTRVIEAADRGRRKIERDLHDGAQQRLVATALSLRLARSLAEADPAQSAVRLDEAISSLRAATSELRELARGIHPAILTDQGLEAAIGSLTARAPLPVTVTSVGEGRISPAAEVTLYFVVAELLTNVARHAQAGTATVTIERGGGAVTVDVTDDGTGGADPAAGSGLAGLMDRVAALDGRLSITAPATGGTGVRVEIPCER